MATSITEEVKKDLIECKICLEVMTKPRVLNCLHTFCEGCIEDLQSKVAGKNDISCPVCRNVTVLPSGGAKSLRANFLINTLQDALGKSAKVIKCEYCDEKCSYTCLDCSDKMCFTHGSSHCNTKYTRGHKVVSLEDVAAGKYAKEILASQIIDCEIHPGKCMEFYCTQCKKMLCVSCKILDHEGHQCTSLEKAGESKLATLTTRLSQMRELSEDLLKFKSEVDTAQTRLVNEKAKITSNIDDIADKMCAEIRHQQAELKKELDSHFNAQTKTYELEKQKSEMDIASMNSGIEFGNIVLKHGRPIDALSFVQQMEQNIKSIQNYYEGQSNQAQGYTLHGGMGSLMNQQILPKRRKILRKSGITLRFEENKQITNPILGSRPQAATTARGFQTSGFSFATTNTGFSTNLGNTDNIQRFGTIYKQETGVELTILADI